VADDTLAHAVFTINAGEAASPSIPELETGTKNSLLASERENGGSRKMAWLSGEGERRRDSAKRRLLVWVDGSPISGSTRHAGEHGQGPLP